ncbi:hypothetical protein BQ8482_111422 [Mesorhizobium delmotii]|uniref:Uncharacterized protein n=1 Tax=Mesorhizobium delmotii TaxID=1631247 RepID=A0A2P9AEB9_9HYPH|nr:hypothetical protein BQ8482_111422 [Mesorhizobium delmotii]
MAGMGVGFDGAAAGFHRHQHAVERSGRRRQQRLGNAFRLHRDLAPTVGAHAIEIADGIVAVSNQRRRLDVESGGERPDHLDAKRGQAALDLAESTDRNAGLGGKLGQRKTAFQPKRAHAPADPHIGVVFRLFSRLVQYIHLFPDLVFGILEWRRAVLPSPRGRREIGAQAETVERCWPECGWCQAGTPLLRPSSARPPSPTRGEGKARFSRLP